MATIEGEIYIDRPPEVVFDVVADERNEPLYNPKMSTVSMLSDAEIGSGSRFVANHEIQDANLLDDDRVHGLRTAYQTWLGLHRLAPCESVGAAHFS